MDLQTVKRHSYKKLNFTEFSVLKKDWILSGNLCQKKYAIARKGIRGYQKNEKKLLYHSTCSVAVINIFLATISEFVNLTHLSFLKPMTSPGKKLNKWLVGFIIGGTILGITGLSSTEKGKGLIGRLLHLIKNRGTTLLGTAERLGSKIGKRP